MTCIQEKPKKMCIDVEPGVKVFVEIEGEGKPIVLIHGWALSHEMWKLQVPYLTEHGYQAVAVDLRGFGNSDRPPAGYTYDTWVNDLEIVINTLDLHDATLVGYSIGGAIAMLYAATRADSRIAKLALVAAAGPYMSWTLDNVLYNWRCGHPPEFWDGLIFLIQQEQHDYAFHQFYENAFPRMTEPEDIEWIARMLESASPQASLGGLKEMKNRDLRESLREIHVPTKIVGGRTDPLVPFTLVEDQHGLVADSTLTLLWGGHGLFFEQADKLNRELAW
jgi:pimeloyl-ACP methyl ester carboxylesterase